MSSSLAWGNGDANIDASIQELMAAASATGSGASARERLAAAETTEGSGSTMSILSLPAEVERAIAELLPSDDPLDAADFSTIDYINQHFPTEQSLNNLDDVMTEMRLKVSCIDDDIGRIVRTQTHVNDEAAAALEAAKSAMAMLFTQIRDIKAKAGESEEMVKSITRDISRLDTAKRNLTTAITTLNHLHMLVNGVTTLKSLSQQRQYGEAAMLLQGLMEVLEHFRNYTEIPQIRELSSQVQAMRRQLGEQITADFQSALSTENAKSFIPNRQFAEACLVVNVLDPKVKKTLLKWLIQRELAEYTIIFAEGQEGTWLDMIDNRYNWLKRHLIEFEERIGTMFPPDWEMSERIAIEFCDITRKHLEKQMFRRKHEIDTKLLLHAIQRTGNFENLLGRRFTGVTLDQYQEKKRMEEEAARAPNPFEENINDPSNPFYEESTAAPEAKPKEKPLEIMGSPFVGIISQCFEPHLSIYIESQDRNLTELVERAAGEQRNRSTTGLAAEGSAVLHSCGDLFMFYKKCMVQCAQLSTGEALLSLANVFRKHLREYANKVLLSSIPKASSANTLSSSVTSITKDLKDFSITTTGLIQNFQSLLKEGDMVRLSDDEKVLLCTILVTAEYCFETTQQLEAKLKDKIDSSLVNKISFSGEQEVYHSIINNCVQLLVQNLESLCEPSLAAMVKVNWSSIDSVGDQSAYVTILTNQMKQSVPLLRENLSSSKKYFTQFCVRFVNTFIPKFIQHVYRCKPVSTVGAEQLLLDTHSVKTLLLDLPTLGTRAGTAAATAAASAMAPSKKAPANYSKIVIKGMTRAEMTMKVVMSPGEPLDAFVDQYIKLVPDADTAEFQKVLDMKGVRKVDQAPYLDYFKASAPQQHNVHSIMSPSTSAGSYAEESRIKKLENLIKKRL